MTTCLALLRAVNVGGQRKVPMAELRALAARLGCAEVRSYIQSGNLVFTAQGRPAALETALEGAIEQHFGFHVDLVVRTARQWAAYRDGNPFAAVAARAPERVLLALSRRPPARGAAALLQERAGAGERVAAVGDALWFHYPAGVGRSKLTPALIDRLVGSPATARNWRTVQQLAELAGI